MVKSMYGLGDSEKDSQVILIPVPWDVTTSYGKGTASGPKSILHASEQIDLYDLDYLDPYKLGIAMKKEAAWIKTTNTQLRKLAEPILARPEGNRTKKQIEQIKKVNQGSDKLNKYLEKEFSKLIAQGKIPIAIGGDHSIPFGPIKAYAKAHTHFGILHIDAHSDTRKAYCDFTHSHASIMYNVVQSIPEVKNLVQIGIRDFCREEIEFNEKSKKVSTFYDQDMKRHLLSGKSFKSWADRVVKKLPKKVYISFDIDGLDPQLCPNTGTPVPGGLDFDQISYLLKLVVKAKIHIIGFDLVEVAPGKNSDWDANVGMRVLYKLIGATLASQKKIRLR